MTASVEQYRWIQHCRNGQHDEIRLPKPNPRAYVEIVGPDLDALLGFYLSIGFELERRSGDFAVRALARQRLFLAGNPDAPITECWRSLRIMVDDVDALWRKANRLQLKIGNPIGDRSLRTARFRARGPSGFGLRFAQVMPHETARQHRRPRPGCRPRSSTPKPSACTPAAASATMSWKCWARDAPIYLLQKAPGSIGADNATRDYHRHWMPMHVDVVVETGTCPCPRPGRGAIKEGEIREASWGRIVQLADPFGHGWCLLQFLGRGYDEIAT